MKEGSASAVSDLTAAYSPSGAKKAIRTVQLTEGRKKAFIQDKIE